MEITKGKFTEAGIGLYNEFISGSNKTPFEVTTKGTYVCYDRMVFSAAGVLFFWRHICIYKIEDTILVGNADEFVIDGADGRIGVTIPNVQLPDPQEDIAEDKVNEVGKYVDLTERHTFDTVSKAFEPVLDAVMIHNELLKDIIDSTGTARDGAIRRYAMFVDARPDVIDYRPDPGQDGPISICGSSVEFAMGVLSEALKDDEGYRISWFSNIKMPIHDAMKGYSLDSRVKISEQAATQIMKNIFHVDV